MAGGEETAVIVAVQQHDYRTLTRVTLAAEAAAKLAAWKKATWQECYGHGTGQTAYAAGETQEILAAVAGAVEAAGIDTDIGITGACHAVIYGEGGECVHATYIGCTEGRYYLAG